jgi:hypothetical protein
MKYEGWAGARNTSYIIHHTSLIQLIFSILFSFPNDIGWPDGQPELALPHAIRDF